MSANIGKDLKTRQLDKRAEPSEEVTEDQVRDVPRMSRLLMRILRDVALLKRRWMPKRIDFEDRDVDDTGTTVYSFTHNFNGRVRWWVVDWASAAGWAALIKDTSSDRNTLRLVSLTIGTVTIRVEQAG